MGIPVAESGDMGLLDSTLESTRRYWREKLRFDQEIINDPRPIAECAAWNVERVVYQKQNFGPDLD